MGQPLAMLSDEAQEIVINGFTDDLGNPAAVDLIEWTIDDPTVATLVVSAGGMNCDVRANPMAAGDPAKNTVVRAHVTENGVADAIQDSHDTMVSSLPSPLATRMSSTVGAPRKQ